MSHLDKDLLLMRDAFWYGKVVLETLHFKISTTSEGFDIAEP